MKQHQPYGPFKRILFCTDFSENADFAFQFAVQQAGAHPDAILMLLHIVQDPEAQFWNTYLYEVDDVDNKAQQDMTDKINEMYMSRLPDGMGMQVAIRAGTTHEQILAYAEEQHADLMVIGRQGRSSIGKMLFGNVTEKIVRKARCAVMMVPLSFEQELEET
jgi:nucleotide-binding universal stress UspA family protein